MRWAGLMAGALAVVSAPVSAQAACMDAPTASAARLHEFETMMMAVSLRCNRIGVDMRGDYDVLLATYRSRFEGAAIRLKAFFGGIDGNRKGAGYDRYSTLLANKYGGGNTTRDRCRIFDDLTREMVKANDGGVVLVAVASAMIERSTLETAMCPVLASARP